jgi:hypothetical protein
MVSAGLDTNGNSILDASEVTTTAYVCNGANGTNGLNSLVAIVTEPAGANCTYGGINVTSGLDTNANGTLDPSEVTTTKYVCNGPGINWVDVTGTSVQAVSNTGYMADNAALVTITLPASPAVGDVIQVNGIGPGGWTIALNAGQSIITQDIVNIAGATTTGTISGAQYDAIELQYIAPNTFSVLNFAGNLVISTLSPGYISEGGLTWMPVSTTLYDYYGAEALCLGSAHDGQTGWRLPTYTELSAFYAAYPNNSAALLGQGWMLNDTWSSTVYITGYRYVVFLNNGGAVAGYDMLSNYVTCVR